jgi:hypothetical protein
MSMLDLAPKERVLEWVDDGEGRAIVASDSALHLQRVPPNYARIGWDEIEHAEYSAGVLTITLTPQQGSATLRLPVGDELYLPVVVRDRVTASVVVDRFEPLKGEAGVRIVGRRSRDGSITWRADLDPELETDPAACAAAETVLTEVRSEVVNN